GGVPETVRALDRHAAPPLPGGLHGDVGGRPAAPRGPRSLLRPGVRGRSLFPAEPVSVRTARVRAVPAARAAGLRQRPGGMAGPAARRAGGAALPGPRV